MSLKKCLKTVAQKQGQSVLEYALLVTITIMALLATTFVVDTRDNAISNHFSTVAGYITNQPY